MFPITSPLHLGLFNLGKKINASHNRTYKIMQAVEMETLFALSHYTVLEANMKLINGKFRINNRSSSDHAVLEFIATRCADDHWLDGFKGEMDQFMEGRSIKCYWPQWLCMHYLQIQLPPKTSQPL